MSAIEAAGDAWHRLDETSRATVCAGLDGGTLRALYAIERTAALLPAGLEPAEAVDMLVAAWSIDPTAPAWQREALELRGDVEHYAAQRLHDRLRLLGWPGHTRWSHDSTTVRCTPVPRHVFEPEPIAHRAAEAVRTGIDPGPRMVTHKGTPLVNALHDLPAYWRHDRRQPIGHVTVFDVEPGHLRTWINLTIVGPRLRALLRAIDVGAIGSSITTIGERSADAGPTGSIYRAGAAPVLEVSLAPLETCAYGAATRATRERRPAEREAEVEAWRAKQREQQQRDERRAGSTSSSYVRTFGRFDHVG
ncbi:hypothetical protein [Demequina pelophila]|uniref:hypothetical protein n=1 Tax=Demequina pelophila TaxID=1638984 RepID=UPI000782019B|nr:hypothetical protein [Demequina pelophila]